MRSSNVMTVFSRSRYIGNIPGNPTIGMPFDTVPPSIWQCVQLNLLPTYFSAYFGVSLKTCMPRRMLSPSGPAGIVEVSGATHLFEESTACGVCGAPKLTEFAENKMKTEKTATTVNPQRMAIARIMDMLLQEAKRATVQLPFYSFRVPGSLV